MKNRYIYFLMTTLFIGCSNTTSSTFNSLSQSVPNNISSSSNYTSDTSSSNLSLSSTTSNTSINDDYYIFDFEESANKLILKSQNKTNIAYSNWTANYLENGVEITTYVFDDDIYYGNIYNYGYDDNIEFLINVKNNESGWLIGGTYHFLINAEGNILFEIARTTNGLSSSMDKSMGVVLGENLKYEFSRLTKETNGFTGYYSKVFIDYKFFGKNDVELVGNLSFCPGMRNSHNYLVDTQWSAYNGRGCKWGAASTFVLINEDGTFGESLSMDLDTLYFGDTIFDKSNWDTFHNDSLGEECNNIALQTTDINYWKKELVFYKDCKIDKIVMYLGYNDIKNNKSIEEVIGGLKEIVSMLNAYFEGVKIYYVSLIVTPELINSNNDIVNINNEMKSYINNNSNISYIDLYNKIFVDNQMRRELFESNTHLNYLGYNILADEIHKSMNLAKNELPSIFGSNNLYSSSNSFKKIIIDNKEYVEGVGDKDQYLFFNKDASNSFESGIKINAKEVYNDDAYPKFGYALVGNDDTLFFYIDGSNGLTKQKVGYVRGKNNSSWQWALSLEKEVKINYNGENFAELKVVYDNSLIYLYVNGDLIFEVSDFFDINELLSVSILSFNTHLLLKDYYII